MKALSIYGQIAFSFFLLASVGCASTKSLVREQAAKDFSCDPRSVSVKRAPEERYWQAEGCNQKSEYSCMGCYYGKLNCTQVYR